MNMFDDFADQACVIILEANLLCCQIVGDYFLTLKLFRQKKNENAKVQWTDHDIPDIWVWLKIMVPMTHRNEHV